MAKTIKRDILIIGGGVGGLVTTSVFAQLGLNVTLFEKSDSLGGDCLHYGCVPSKTLIRSSYVAHLMRHAPQYGLPATTGTVDLGAVMARVQAVVAHIQHHDDPERFRAMGAEVNFGPVEFIDDHHIKYRDQDYYGKRIIIATGSSPMIPPISGLSEIDYLTNETIFKLKTLPKRLVILGGGVIGLELAQAMARLGSTVTILEMMPQIAPALDSEAREALINLLQEEGISIHTQTQVTEVSKISDEIIIKANHLNTPVAFTADSVLVATGRKPNLQGLNIEAAGIKTSRFGIEVDARLRTHKKHIFALGDCMASPYKLTHAAEYQAGIVIANIAFRFPKKVNYAVMPAVVYTQPEIAMVGLSEVDAKAMKMPVDVIRFNVADIDRAITDGETTGFIKLIIHKNRIKGAVIMGPHAGELLGEISLAISQKLKMSAISNLVHAYPTLSQLHRRAVNQKLGQQLFTPRVKKLVQWLMRWLP